MKTWWQKYIVPHFDDDELNSRAFNLNVILLVTFAVMLLGIVAMLLQLTSRPLAYVLPNVTFIVIAALVIVWCYVLSRRGKVLAGSIIFVTMMSVACIGAVVVGGTQGALGVILIIPVASAGTSISGAAGVGMAALSVVTLVIVGFLERSGVIVVDYPAPEMTLLLNMFDVGFALVFATLSVWLSGYSVRRALGRARASVAEAQRYQQELETSLAAEQALLDRLQNAVNEYTTFMEDVGRGDYRSRLAPVEEQPQLFALGQQINALVETLVAEVERAEFALRQAESAQRRYTTQGWRDYARASMTDFAVGDIARPEVLREALQQALTQRNLAVVQPEDTAADVSDAALAIPIVLGGQVTGVLALARDAQAPPWNEDQKALLNAVVERLALAIESQRLFRDVQQRAAREQVSAQVTARIRESLDMETVLKTAVSEMRQALGLEGVIVQLARPESLNEVDHA